MWSCFLLGFECLLELFLLFISSWSDHGDESDLSCQTTSWVKNGRPVSSNSVTLESLCLRVTYEDLIVYWLICGCCWYSWSCFFIYFDNVGNVDVVDVDDVDRKLLLASHVLGQELGCGMRRQIKQSINNSSSTHKTTIATSRNDNINRKQYPSKTLQKSNSW